MDNTKHRADTILDALQELVTERGAARVIRARKPSASLPMPPSIAQRLLSANVFITAVGD
ncbi:MAG TPA: hypothetical protein VNJ51_06415 [Candidatus Dormibacteraeota bacterium]|nr:hypothetical protein [Candidatus Dormibacteraeota bacterium]